jgi:hypothetical protein
MPSLDLVFTTHHNRTEASPIKALNIMDIRHVVTLLKTIATLLQPIIFIP